MIENVCNTFLKSGGGELLGGGLVTRFVSILGIEFWVKKGYIGGTLVGMVLGGYICCIYGQI